MGFWDWFISLVCGGGGGAVLAYVAQTAMERRSRLFGMWPFQRGWMGGNDVLDAQTI